MPAPDVCEPWPFDATCCDLPEDVDPGQVDRWVSIATQLLFRLSGRRYGASCPVVTRPCRRACLESYPLAVRWGAVGQWVPYIDAAGAWRNASVCGCSSDCSCGQLCEVRLEAPVHDIVEVRVDGKVLPAGAYRVDAPALLVRTDGGCWPRCQDMAAPPDAEGTFAVTYRLGVQLDEAAIAAHSELVCHLLKGCGGSGSGCGCRLPANATRVARQGVTVEMADLAQVHAEGRTGLPTVDLWLRTVNPNRLTGPSRVFSPDLRRPRTQIWPRGT